MTWKQDVENGVTVYLCKTSTGTEVKVKASDVSDLKETEVPNDLMTKLKVLELEETIKGFINGLDESITQTG